MININYKPPTNTQRWKTLQNGSFAIIEGNATHPIPKGLYRIFLTNNEDNTNLVFILLPLFDGPFPQNLFPFMLQDDSDLPTIVNTVAQVHLDVELA